MDSSTNNIPHFSLALQYYQAGYSLISIPRGKKEAILGWKKYQTTRLSEQELQQRWSVPTPPNIAIVTGRISKIVVVDVDPRNGGTESIKKLHLPPTYVVKTGGDGFHYYYSWTHDYPAPSCKPFDGIDIQGEGKYVIAPPSIHPSGKAYEASNGLDEMTPAPEWLENLVKQEKEKLWKTDSQDVAEGKRNDTATSTCGKVLSLLPKKLWNTAGWGGLKEWNKSIKKPLDEKELRSVFDSVKNIAESDDDEEEESERASIAKKIVDLVLKEKPILAHDAHDTTFAYIKVDDHNETHPIQSSRFKNWVLRQWWKQEKKPPTGEQVRQALDTLSSIAMFDGPRFDLANRVVLHEQAIWIDLSNDRWQAVKITPSGWEIVNDPPMIFRRQRHQLHQCLPQSGGQLDKILDYINIKDDGQKLLLIVYLVSCFIPGIPHPIPVVYGSQGSAKSTSLRILRLLIDPSSMSLLSFPTTIEQLVQQLSHHWTAFYDNITWLPEWLSDALCRAVTGEGFSKREHYTNDEDIIYSFRCCVGLNGINIAAQKPDLLDRSILFELARIDPELRKDEATFLANFEKDRPYILGAIYDILGKAMGLYPEVKIEKLPRMADFALWGCAITQALGRDQEAFLDAYAKNIKSQNTEAIHEHPVASAVYTFMEDKEIWRGTATQLLGLLNEMAVDQNIDTHQKSWPKAPQILTRRINEARTNLIAIGINVTFSSGGYSRLIIFERLENTVSTDVSSDDDTDASDDTSVTPKQVTDAGVSNLASTEQLNWQMPPI